MQGSVCARHSLWLETQQAGPALHQAQEALLWGQTPAESVFRGTDSFPSQSSSVSYMLWCALEFIWFCPQEAFGALWEGLAFLRW